MKIVQFSCITLLLLFCILPMFVLSSTDGTYERKRREISNEENDQRLGSQLVLNGEESIVNKYLMKLKEKEMEVYDSGMAIHPSSILFTDAKKQIDQSKIFHFLRKMPKGGLLHVHGTAMTSVDWLVSFVTYLPNCYMCWDREKEFISDFIFYTKLPPLRKGCAWERVSHARKYYIEGVKAFDEMLTEAILFSSNKLRSVESNRTAIWNVFEQYFTITNKLIRYKPVFPQYIYHGLTELYEDNIQHFEIRISLSSVYDIDGNLSSAHDIAEQLISAITLFKEKDCENCTARIIVTSHRNAANSAILKSLNNAIDLSKEYPEYFVGFDLVGREDTGKSLRSLLNILRNKNISYYFHVGETDDQGSSVDENLVDAILLGTKRIGHGYALVKHPKLLKLVQERNLPIEVCPISNQMLGFVRDLRNHPATYLIANNFTVVINNDDPCIWKASGLSHDFYLTFMGMASRKADLRTLKQLAINSIVFSSLTAADQAMTLANWEQRWDEFITQAASYIGRNGRRDPAAEESFYDDLGQEPFRNVFREPFNK